MANGRRTNGSSLSPGRSIDKKESEESKQEGVPIPSRKRTRSESSPETPAKSQSPAKWRSPRRCPNLGLANGLGQILNGGPVCSVKSAKVLNGGFACSPKSPKKILSFPQKAKWNPRDSTQMKAAKEALHVSTAPKNVVCREGEQKRVLEFCKACIEQQKAGSLYACGCPGTGKTLTIGKVKELLLEWTIEAGFQAPDILTVNCTSLTNTSEIFNKILERCHPRKKVTGNSLPLQNLQNLCSQENQYSYGRMMLIIVDEMDYLITKDRAVLHDLFMLTNFPFSRFILIGIANAIDLADRFLPRLKSLNCKPVIVTFRAYSKDQILNILQQRLMVLGYDVFQPLALEFCARKVAAASGDVRKALGACMSAIEMLEVDLRDPTTKQEANNVTFDHMDISLSKAFKSPVVDTIQSLPQHQQIILCTVVKLLRGNKNSITLGELNKYYSDICKSTQIPAAGMPEFSNMCRVLSDQGLLKLGPSRDDKLRRVTLPIDSSDINFSLKGIRFFRSCLEY